MLLYDQFADHVLPLEKKSLLEMQKRWVNQINTFIYQNIYYIYIYIYIYIYMYILFLGAS